MQLDGRGVVPGAGDERLLECDGVQDLQADSQQGGGGGGGLLVVVVWWWWWCDGGDGGAMVVRWWWCVLTLPLAPPWAGTKACTPNASVGP